MFNYSIIKKYVDKNFIVYLKKEFQNYRFRLEKDRQVYEFIINYSDIKKNNFPDHFIEMAFEEATAVINRNILARKH